jgi:seryl-tRNA synthetase
VLDLRGIREDPAAVRSRLAAKREPGALEAFDALLEADAAWRRLLVRAEELRARRNAVSEEVARARRGGGEPPEQLRAESRSIGAELAALEEQLAPAEARVRELLLLLPNLPDAEAPPGDGEADNREVHRWGTPRTFAFAPRPHWELGPELGVLDFARAAKLAGQRFVVFRGRGAMLVRALQTFMLDLHVREHGCTEVLPPFVVRSACMLGTAQLPKFGEAAYRLHETDLWLVPTAEVPVTNLYRDEILPGEALPIRHVAYTPCWRSEAGAAGRDTRGLIRQHQFDKVEIVHFVQPSASARHLAEIVRSAEAVLQALELPYRVVDKCPADMGFGPARQFDLEVWMPSYGRYVEISSCSNYRDFQARRANIRFRPERGAPPQFVHTLNGSGLAIGRTVAALLENGQQADGRVRLPQVLAPYLHGDVEWRPA